MKTVGLGGSPVATHANDRESGAIGGLRSWQTLVALASVVLLAVELVSLNRYSLWNDEAATGLFERDSFGGLVAHLVSSPESESAQPLYYLVLWPWLRLVGESETTLRLPSLLLCVATAAVLWRCAVILGVTDRHARIAAASFLALPVIIWYALEARPYSLVLLCVALHLWESLRYLTRRHRPLWPLAFLTLVTALAFSVAGAGALLVLAIVWANRVVRRVHRGAKQRWLFSWQLLASTPPLLLTLLLIAASAARSTHVVLYGSRAPAESLAYTLYELALGRTIGPSVNELRHATSGGSGGISGLLATTGWGLLLVAATISVSLGAVVLIGLASARSRRPRETWLVGIPWLCTAALFAGYAAAHRLPLVGRHVLFALPALFVLVACGIAAAPPRVRFLATLAAWIAGTVALTGLVGAPRYAKDDYRDVASTVQRCQFRPGAIFVADKLPVRGFLYYGMPGQSGSVHSGIEFLAARFDQRAVLIVNTDRLDLSTAQIDSLRATGHLFVERFPGFTMLSTRSVTSC